VILMMLCLKQEFGLKLAALHHAMAPGVWHQTPGTDPARPVSPTPSGYAPQSGLVFDLRHHGSFESLRLGRHPIQWTRAGTLIRISSPLGPDSTSFLLTRASSTPRPCC
jgi:hypothetical protein